MADESGVVMEAFVKAHGAAADEDIVRLRALSVRERGALIESACEAAAAIHRSRLAAGLPDIEPAPWPPSMWEFLRKHAARVRTWRTFKMMFFRRKDLADVEQILRTQGAQFDRLWVREQLAGMYGARDPRLSEWDHLVGEIPAR